ncbi:MAG: glycosyltransferase family 2 protein [Anaerolineae bacterium]
MTKLASVILTLNESKHISACIETLQWTDQVVVVDSYSSDDTCDLARNAGASVIQHPFENYAQQRNFALESVNADWILFVDADERSTPALAREVRHVIEERRETGWWIPRHNYIMGHRMRATGWYPDYQMRLLKRTAATYDPNRGVHELVVLQGEAGHLTSHLIHYNYETLRAFRAKQRRYLDYDIKVMAASGIRPKFYSPYTQAVRHFWWRFITLQGWKDTVWGLLLSVLMGIYEGMKVKGVLQLQRASGQPSREKT